MRISASGCLPMRYVEIAYFSPSMQASDRCQVRVAAQKHHTACAKSLSPLIFSRYAASLRASVERLVKRGYPLISFTAPLFRAILPITAACGTLIDCR